jgi:hypothetical protein
MKKTLFVSILIMSVLAFARNAGAQMNNENKTEIPTTSAANPTDVSSIDAIVKAVYELISGGSGQKRDWDRFRLLFYKDARMIPTGKSKKTGNYGARTLSIEEYIERSTPLMEKGGFFEREMARRTETYGNIAHVFSTYQSFLKEGDKKPFERGINSFQLVNDGKRWWILAIMWQGETPESPLPKKYLKGK